MVGGGIRKDNDELVISNRNGFAVLGISESDQEEEGFDELDHEAVAMEKKEPAAINKPVEVVANKETVERRQYLSKKELKKKELDDELKQLIAQFDAPKLENANDDGNKKENAKKKKKKAKSSKVSKEQPSGTSEDDNAEIHDTDNGTVEDVKEKIKKLVAPKKKKKPRNDQKDAPTRIAARETAARNANLDPEKKKKNSHYNQQPPRKGSHQRNQNLCYPRKIMKTQKRGDKFKRKLRL